MSVWELFWPLLAGANRCWRDQEEKRSPAYLRTLLREEGITTLHFVPSMLQVFCGRSQ